MVSVDVFGVQSGPKIGVGFRPGCRVGVGLLAGRLGRAESADPGDPDAFRAESHLCLGLRR